MNLKYKPRHHQINWVYTTSFPGRQFPLVLIDGEPSYVLNQYLYSLHEEQITQSSLEAVLTALTHMFEFTVARCGNTVDSEQAKGLVAEFIDARKFGTDQYCLNDIDDPRHGYLHSLGLHWEPLTNYTTIEKQVGHINDFDQWQATVHCAERLNPVEIVFKSAFEIYHDFKISSEWDVLGHLHGTRQHTKKEYEATVRPKREHNRKARDEKKQKTDKAFPYLKFVDLVDTSCNPRDKMLMLLCGGGSLRRSEPLQMLFTDVEGTNEYGEAKVRLADPEKGRNEWDDPDTGLRTSGTRTEYFKQVWQNSDLPVGHEFKNLQPRTFQGKRNSGLQVGFKGMTFTESEGRNIFDRPGGRMYDINFVWWIDLKMGGYFYQCYQEYLNKYIYNNPYTGKPNPPGWPYHPWLFINIDKANYGRPMSVSALKGVWSRSLDRLKLSHLQLGIHSLRHMYGYYCANILKFSLEFTSAIMHHSLMESTKTYFRLTQKTMKDEMTKKQLEAMLIDVNIDLLIMPGSPPIVFPEHWTCEAHTLMLEQVRLLAELKGQRSIS